MIIGLCGLIGSGKDTIAEHLVAKYDYHRLSMAESLKDCVSAAFGYDRNMLEGDTKESRLARETIDVFWAERLNIPTWSPRFALQYVGTELFRNNLHRNMWVIATERKLYKYNKVVISDIRFPNELDMLRRNNGKIVWVQRGELPTWWDTAISTNGYQDGRKLMAKEYPDIHYSEYALAGQNFDCVINNNSTYDELYNQVDNVIYYL